MTLIPSVLPIRSLAVNPVFNPIAPEGRPCNVIAEEIQQKQGEVNRLQEAYDKIRIKGVGREYVTTAMFSLIFAQRELGTLIEEYEATCGNRNPSGGTPVPVSVPVTEPVPEEIPNPDLWLPYGLGNIPGFEPVTTNPTPATMPHTFRHVTHPTTAAMAVAASVQAHSSVTASSSSSAPPSSSTPASSFATLPAGHATISWLNVNNAAAVGVTAAIGAAVYFVATKVLGKFTPVGLGLASDAAFADGIQPHFIDYKVDGQIHRLTRLNNASTTGSFLVDPKRQTSSLSSGLYIETDLRTDEPTDPNKLLAPILGLDVDIPYTGFKQINYPTGAEALTYTGFHGKTHELPLTANYNIGVFNPKSGEQLK
jgi:hypothetical protein